jgi:hypothetical protein
MADTPDTRVRKIKAPVKDWLTEQEATTYLGVNVIAFQAMLDAGWIAGVRKVSSRQTLYFWKGIVAAQWRLEMEHLPLAEKPAKLAANRPKSKPIGEIEANSATLDPEA